VKPDYGWGKLLFEIFEKTVEAELVQPTFITAHPTEVSPLARANDADPEITDRFELFIGGKELANGFSELNDPEDQEARFKARSRPRTRRPRGHALRRRLHPRARVRHAAHRRLGVGIDRLVMLLADVPSIRDVLLFPYMRPEA
jgi:lysyl-tRNA synthetase class 2